MSLALQSFVPFWWRWTIEESWPTLEYGGQAKVRKVHSHCLRAGPVAIGWRDIKVSAAIYYDNLGIKLKFLSTVTVQQFSVCGSNNCKYHSNKQGLGTTIQCKALKWKEAGYKSEWHQIEKQLENKAKAHLPTRMPFNCRQNVLVCKNLEKISIKCYKYMQ